MDLNTVSSIVPLHDRGDLGRWTPGASWLAGGSWLFSESQVGIDTLLDLASFNWPPIVIGGDTVEIAATCTFAQLLAYPWPTEFVGASLVDACCRSLLGSFKVWNVATVGGNICLALPAGPMTAFATALDGTGVIWTPGGADRRVAIKDLVTGVTRTALQPGELLRSIEVPVAALRRRAAHRRISLSIGGRSGALLIAMRDGPAFQLTITASTPRPIRMDFAQYPSPGELRAAIDTVLPLAAYYDDLHGRPAWRQHVTRLFAEELRSELAGG